MCVGFDEGADVWKVHAARAIKAHKCDECDLPIPRGSIELVDEGEDLPAGERRCEYGAIATWLWDIAKAQYQEAA